MKNRERVYMYRMLLALTLSIAAISLPAAATSAPERHAHRRRRAWLQHLAQESGRLECEPPRSRDVRHRGHGQRSDRSQLPPRGPGVDMSTAARGNGRRHLDGDVLGRHVHVPLRRAPGADEGPLHRRQRAAATASASATRQAERQGDREGDLAEDGRGRQGQDPGRQEVQAHGLGHVEHAELPPQGARA